MRSFGTWIGPAVALLILAAGCGKQSGTTSDPSASQQANASASDSAPSGAKSPLDAMASDTPEAATTKFLEAVRTGNDQVAETMFTKLARDRIKELDIQVAPRGSDTAKFEVGKAEMLTDDGARVPCKWTDVDKEGNSRTDDMIWMLSRQPDGWRVVGMAAVVFEGEDPLLLDFENPKELLDKLKRLNEEIAKRSSAQNGESAQSEGSGEQVRR